MISLQQRVDFPLSFLLLVLPAPCRLIATLHMHASLSQAHQIGLSLRAACLPFSGRLRLYYLIVMPVTDDTQIIQHSTFQHSTFQQLWQTVALPGMPSVLPRVTNSNQKWWRNKCAVSMILHGVLTKCFGRVEDSIKYQIRPVLNVPLTLILLFWLLTAFVFVSCHCLDAIGRRLSLLYKPSQHE